MPKISVITVCFNAEKYIEQTIKSVIEQKNCKFEYIIVDGASTDQTAAIIRRYQSKITRWISEPDKGIADAMNKGINLATGDYLLFLHADDYLISDTVISQASACMQDNAEIHAFDVIYKTQTNEIRKSTKPFGIRTYFKTPVMHQGAFCKKSLFELLNGFNTNLRIAMDYEFFYKAYKQNVKMIIHPDLLVSVMRDTGVSSRQDRQSLEQRFLEEKRIHLETDTSATLEVIYAIYWAIYLPCRRIKCTFSEKKRSII